LKYFSVKRDSIGQCCSGGKNGQDRAIEGASATCGFHQVKKKVLTSRNYVQHFGQEVRCSRHIEKYRVKERRSFMDELVHEQKASASQNVPARALPYIVPTDGEVKALREPLLRRRPEQQRIPDKGGKTLLQLSSPDDKQPEELLVEHAKQRNREAFDVLIKRYESAIQRYIRRASSIEDDKTIEDITQETFLKAWLSLPMHDPKRTMNFRPWLYRVAYTTTIDYLRGNQLEHLLISVEGRGEKAAKQSSWVQQVEDGLCQRESLVAAFSQVYPKYRQCLVLRFIEGYSFQEIAEELSINESTVRANISYGRKQLDQAYQRELNNDTTTNTRNTIERNQL